MCQPAPCGLPSWTRSFFFMISQGPRHRASPGCLPVELSEATHMTPFLSGALGAVTVLFLAALVRRAAWRHLRRRGPARLGWLFRRIGARPEQEQAIRAEADALSEAFLALRGDVRGLRGDLADLLAAPALDDARVRELLDARLVRTEALRA